MLGLWRAEYSYTRATSMAGLARFGCLQRLLEAQIFLYKVENLLATIYHHLSGVPIWQRWLALNYLLLAMKKQQLFRISNWLEVRSLKQNLNMTTTELRGCRAKVGDFLPEEAWHWPLVLQRVIGMTNLFD